MKLLNWQFQYWHFNKYFIPYTSTVVMNLFALRNIAKVQKSSNEILAISSLG